MAVFEYRQDDVVVPGRMPVFENAAMPVAHVGFGGANTPCWLPAEMVTALDNPT